MSLKFGSIKVLKDSFFGLKFCDFGASIKNKIDNSENKGERNQENLPI